MWVTGRCVRECLLLADDDPFWVRLDVAMILWISKWQTSPGGRNWRLLNVYVRLWFSLKHVSSNLNSDKERMRLSYSQRQKTRFVDGFQWSAQTWTIKAHPHGWNGTLSFCLLTFGNNDYIRGKSVIREFYHEMERKQSKIWRTQLAFKSRRILVYEHRLMNSSLYGTLICLCLTHRLFMLLLHTGTAQKTVRKKKTVFCFFLCQPLT